MDFRGCLCGWPKGGNQFGPLGLANPPCPELVAGPPRAHLAVALCLLATGVGNWNHDPPPPQSRLAQPDLVGPLTNPLSLKLGTGL